MARRSIDRLVRLLALPAWVAEHEGASFEEAAAHFGVTAAMIRSDVETLWVSGLAVADVLYRAGVRSDLISVTDARHVTSSHGIRVVADLMLEDVDLSTYTVLFLPGGMPGDLVDFSADDFEAGRLRLTEPLGLDRPVRLSRQEAVALLLSLRVLGDVLADDPASAAALHGAQAALTAALRGGARPVAPPAGADDPASGSGTAVLRTVRRAMAERRRLRLTYVSATDTRSVREVDPLELITDGSHLTVRAWCLSARDERSFRLDRILNVELLDATATTHRARRRHGEPRSSRSRTAVLTLAPGGRWLVEQVDAEKIEILPEGAIRAQVRGRDEDWLVGLVLSAGRHIRGVLPRSLALRARGAAQRALALNASVEGS